MSISVQLNNNSWDIIRRLHDNEANMFRAMERLSSGLRINRASDGPAALVISEQLRSQVASLDREMENLAAQQLRYEYASSTVMQLRGKLTEMRTLALGAANAGGNSQSAQEAFDRAAAHMVDNYNHIVATTEYNGRLLFDGGEGSLASPAALDGIDLSSAAAAEVSLERIDQAIVELDRVQVDLGSTVKNRFESEQASLAITRQNLAAAESNIRDADWAMEFSRYMAESIQFRAGIALMAHNRLNAQIVLSIFDR